MWAKRWTEPHLIPELVWVSVWYSEWASALECEAGTLEDHARLMYQRIQELRLPTWIIGPPPSPGEPTDQPAEILKVTPSTSRRGACRPKTSTRSSIRSPTSIVSRRHARAIGPAGHDADNGAIFISVSHSAAAAPPVTQPDCSG